MKPRSIEAPRPPSPIAELFARLNLPVVNLPFGDSNPAAASSITANATQVNRAIANLSSESATSDTGYTGKDKFRRLVERVAEITASLEALSPTEKATVDTRAFSREIIALCTKYTDSIIQFSFFYEGNASVLTSQIQHLHSRGVLSNEELCQLAESVLRCQPVPSRDEENPNTMAHLHLQKIELLAGVLSPLITRRGVDGLPVTRTARYPEISDGVLAYISQWAPSILRYLATPEASPAPRLKYFDQHITPFGILATFANQHGTGSIDSFLQCFFEALVPFVEQENTACLSDFEYYEIHRLPLDQSNIGRVLETLQEYEVFDSLRFPNEAVTNLGCWYTQTLSHRAWNRLRGFGCAQKLGITIKHEDVRDYVENSLRVAGSNLIQLASGVMAATFALEAGISVDLPLVTDAATRLYQAGEGIDRDRVPFLFTHHIFTVSQAIAAIAGAPGLLSVVFAEVLSCAEPSHAEEVLQLLERKKPGDFSPYDVLRVVEAFEFSAEQIQRLRAIAQVAIQAEVQQWS